MSRRGHVRLQAVGKSFGAVSVLRAIDLEIRPGEFVRASSPAASSNAARWRARS
jgi:hypothetical protein